MNDIQKRVLAWWDERLRRFFEPSTQDQSRAERLRQRVLALVYLTTRETLRDRGPTLAASLSFWTVLAVVPLLTVAASLMAAFGVLQGEDGAFYGLLHQLFPEVASGIASYLSETATENAQAVGGIGAVTLLIIGLVLFNAVEESLTRIWRGTRERSMVAKMLTFYAMVTFGPILIALSIVQTASAQLYLVQLGVNLSWAEWAMPPLFALIAFTLLNKLVPDADVKWTAALVGGLFTMVAFELAKWGFNLYVNQLLLQTYDRVYGALALIPISLIWVYVSWFVLLLGAELSYAFQHLQDLMRAEAGRRSSQARSAQYHTIHPMVALEVLTPIVTAFEGGDGPIKRRDVERRLRLPKSLLQEILERWKDEGIIVVVKDDDGDVAFVPGRPPHKMAIEELIDPFWSDGGDAQGQVAQLSQRYLEASKKFFRGQSAKELVTQSEAAPKSPGSDGQATPTAE